MSGVLTKIRLAEGVWEGVMPSSEARPALRALHLDREIDGLEVTRQEGASGWRVRLPVPLELISDGVQTFVIADADTGEHLASFALLAGEALSEDIRAEMDLLRAELDMLKRAFRRHCLETL